MTKVAKAPKINAGQVAQYNIEVTALGTGIHPGVTLTDVLPGGSAKGWTVSGADAAACDEDPNTAGIQIVGTDLNCNFGDINPAVDATRNVSISVTTDRRAVRHQVEHGDGGDDGQDGCRPGEQLGRSGDHHRGTARTWA